MYWEYCNLVYASLVPGRVNLSIRETLSVHIDQPFGLVFLSYPIGGCLFNMCYDCYHRLLLLPRAMLRLSGLVLFDPKLLPSDTDWIPAISDPKWWSLIPVRLANSIPGMSKGVAITVCGAFGYSWGSTQVTTESFGPSAFHG